MTIPGRIQDILQLNFAHALSVVYDRRAIWQPFFITAQLLLAVISMFDWNFIYTHISSWPYTMLYIFLVLDTFTVTSHGHQALQYHYIDQAYYVYLTQQLMHD